MINTQQIGVAFERNARALSKRPSLGRNTASTSVRITSGMTCEIEEGPWRLTADMPPKVGGSEAGPTPGVLGRGALGSCLAIRYVPDPPGALREMHRLLRAGGHAVAAVWGRRDRCGWADIFPVVDRRVSSDVCPMFFQLGVEGALEHTFREAGFSDVEGQRISTVLRYESADDACGAAFAGGPVAMAYARFDEPTRAEAHEEYLDSIAPYREGASYAIPGEFVVVRGVRPTIGA